MAVSPGTNVRRAELLAVLSLGADLGLGQPMEHVLRECLIAMRLGERIGLNETERVTVYYAALLTWVGCHVDAYEQAKWFGDDLAFKSDFPLVDHPGTGFVLKHLGAGRPFLDRARLGVTFLGDGRRDADSILDNHRTAAEELAAQLGLGQDVRDSLGRPSSAGTARALPGRPRVRQISVASRLVSLADVVEVFHRAGGVPAAIAVARERSGTQFDPALVDAFCRDAAELFGGIESATTWDAVIAAEPELEVVLTDEELDTALAAMANFADLKSPYTLGHSCAVAELAGAAARIAGLPDADVALVRRAGFVHDLGRLGVSNAIWDKRGELTPAELERVRLHPYLTERMLASSAALAPLGAVAVQHHERLDGSGYPRGTSGESLTPGGEDPGRGRHVSREARAATAPPRARARGGGLASPRRGQGGPARRRRGRRGAPCGGPSGRGGVAPGRPDSRRGRSRCCGSPHSGSRTARSRTGLVISRKTAANHVEHIYAKIGVSNRARASLFAVRNGLIADPQRGRGLDRDPIVQR